MRKDKLSPGGLEMEFAGGLTEEVTAHAGVALLVETARRSGVLATADWVLLADPYRRRRASTGRRPRS